MLKKITKCFKQQRGVGNDSRGSLGRNDFQFFTEKPFLCRHSENEPAELRCRPVEPVTNANIFISSLTTHRPITKGRSAAHPHPNDGGLKNKPPNQRDVDAALKQ